MHIAWPVFFVPATVMYHGPRNHLANNGAALRMTISRRTLLQGLLSSSLISSRIALAVPFAASDLFAVEEHQSALQFDVATIKPSDTTKTIETGLKISDGGVVTIGGASLLSLITTAWDINYWQVESHADAWASKTLYNIVAKPPELPPQQGYRTRHSWFTIADPRLRAMLQSLLRERFQLKLHQEQRSSAAYALERDDHTPLRLVPVDDPPQDTAPRDINTDVNSDEFGMSTGTGFMINRMSMPGLAKALSTFVYHKPVVDHTGLTGIYNFESKTRATTEDFQAGAENSLFLAAIKEMGLRTRQTQAPAEIFIIDSATPPTPN